VKFLSNYDGDGGRQQDKGKAVKLLIRFLKDETGTTAIEYALIAGATCLALGASMPVFGSKLADTYAKIASYFT
jgi:Flp pilus assembly pilin Flp